jgi:hypothetical protein
MVLRCPSKSYRCHRQTESGLKLRLERSTFFRHQSYYTLNNVRFLVNPKKWVSEFRKPKTVSGSAPETLKRFFKDEK